MRIFRKDVSNEEVKSYMTARLEGLMAGVVPRGKREHDPGQTANVRLRYAPGGSVNEQSGSLRPEPDVTTEEKELLESILAEPNLSVTARASRLGLSACKMNGLKKSAAKKKLVEQFTVNWGKEHGGNVTLLALSREGCKVLGKKPEEKPENVSLEHWWWQVTIAAYFRKKEITAEIEKSRNGKRADVCLTSNGKCTAVEVEMSPRNAVSNVVEDLKAGFHGVVCCCKDAAVAREVRRRLQVYEGYEGIMDRVKVRVLSELRLVNEMGKR